MRRHTETSLTTKTLLGCVLSLFLVAALLPSVAAAQTPGVAAYSGTAPAAVNGTNPPAAAPAPAAPAPAAGVESANESSPPAATQPTATAEAAPAVVSSGTLPFTGLQIALMVGAGMGLLGMGLALRRVTSTALPGS